MQRFIRFSSIATTMALIFFCGSLFAQQPGQPPAGGAPGQPPAGGAPKPKTIEEVTKTCKKMPGLFNLYQDTATGMVYLSVKKEQLGKEFIYFAYTENGVPQVGHFRGNFRDNQVFSMNRYFDRLQFVSENTNFYFDPKNALSKAAKANISAAILASQKIAAESATDILIDATTIFVGEALHQVKPSPIPNNPLAALQFGLGTLNRDKSRYAALKNYPKNTDVLMEYVYDNPAPINRGGNEVTDARAVSIMIQHSFIEMPQNSFKPRFDDPRIGYFSQGVDDLTSTETVNFRDFINRWHLEKKDKTAALSEPVEPITFWIENTTPVEFRETIKNAVLAWNIAYEAAGIKNAMRVEIQPDNATWDAGDIRYNVIRWTSSPTPPFGGYGPSFVNPRTGQILGADIMLEYVYMTNRMRQEKLFNAAAFEMEEPTPAGTVRNPHQFCMAGHHLHHQTMFGLAAAKAQGLSEVESKDLLKQSLYYLVLHEVGHTLGLNHNMKASNLYTPAEINNKSVTEKTGLIGSVMDYPAVNIAQDKSKQGQYFTTVPGPYDRWVIEYGYSQALDDSKAEQERLNKILSRSTEPALTFGNDADDMRAPGAGIDPRVMINDLSGDVITYSIERIQLVNKLAGKLRQKYSTKDASYQELLQAYTILSGEMMNAAGAMSRYVGGVYVDRAMAGQTGAKKPFTPVSAAEQKRALQGLGKYVFAPDAFDAGKDAYDYLQMQRRSFNFFGRTEDPKLHDRALAIQRNVLAHLMHPTVLRRMTDTRLYGNTYAVSEYMGDLTNVMFKDDMSGNVNTFRQNLQTEYVNRLIAASGLSGAPAAANPFAPAPAPDFITQAAALQNLKTLKKSLTGSLKGNSETVAHRELLLFKITTALEKK